MARFVKGDIVVVPYPFSDLERSKRRPALVVANLEDDDLILCQITSRQVTDQYAMPLNAEDYAEGGLRRLSNARPNRILTVDTNVVLYKAGRLSPSRMSEIIEAIVQILRRG